MDRPLIRVVTAGVLALALASPVGCGRKGPPRPLHETLEEPPAALTLRQLGESLLLAWDLPAAGPAPAGFHVYKRSYLPGNECPECPDPSAPWRRIDLDYPRQAEREGNRLWTWDDLVAPGTGYRYRVVSLGPSAGEGGGAVARKVMVEPPQAPAELLAEPFDRSVRLQWPAAEPAAGTLLGYRVYRGLTDLPMPPRPLHGGLLTETRYEDFAVRNGVSYRYGVRTVTTVDGQEAESPLSPLATTVPGPPPGKSP